MALTDYRSQFANSINRRCNCRKSAFADCTPRVRRSSAGISASAIHQGLKPRLERHNVRLRGRTPPQWRASAASRPAVETAATTARSPPSRTGLRTRPGGCAVARTRAGAASGGRPWSHAGGSHPGAGLADAHRNRGAHSMIARLRLPDPAPRAGARVRDARPEGRDTARASRSHSKATGPGVPGPGAVGNSGTVAYGARSPTPRSGGTPKPRSSNSSYSRSPMNRARSTQRLE